KRPPPRLLPSRGRHSRPSDPHNNLAQVLRQVPVLTQPSHFIWAWDRHFIQWLKFGHFDTICRSSGVGCSACVCFSELGAEGYHRLMSTSGAGASPRGGSATADVQRCCGSDMKTGATLST
ncbi:Dual-specificity RNA methyltransferase RlmN, partial [Clarias magur]